MRRLVLLAACSAVALMFSPVPAFADNGPHTMGAGVLADGCAGCHRVHTAKADMLTMQAQPALCYTCHGATASGADTNVVDGVAQGGSTGALRGGGFAYALIDSADPGSDTVGVKAAGDPATKVTSSHTVDGTSATAWGNGPTSETANPGKTIALHCGSCHDPHGNGNYRILRAVPSDSGATGVAIADVETAGAGNTKTYTTTNYWNVADTNASSYIGNVSAWCSTCHTRYLSDSAEDASGDALYSFRHRSNAMTPGGPSCIKCHVSHGSNSSMGTSSTDVHNPDGTAGTGGGSKLLRIDNRGTCQMCHDDG